MNHRYLSLDVFRGMTIALMILVNTAGNGDTTYAPLHHASWHGFTPTDLVFPSFMFIVGVAMRFAFKPFNYQLSGEAVKKILKRTFLLFLISYLIFNFPYIHFKLANLRIFNVLQRIALGFCAVGFLALTIRRKEVLWGIGVSLLVLYWLIMWQFGDPADPYGRMGNAALKFDLWLMGPNHLYHGEGYPFDPEGMLSTLPAIVTTLLGYLTGMMIQETTNKLQVVKNMIVLGIIGVGLGLLWDMAFPINKKLWTSSYVIFVAGIDWLILSVLIWLIDVQQLDGKWTKFFTIFGANSIFAYGLSELLAITLWAIPVSDSTTTDGSQPLYSWLYWHAYFPTFGDYNGSLAFAVSVVLFCWFWCWVLYKRKVFLKV